MLASPTPRRSPVRNTDAHLAVSLATTATALLVAVGAGDAVVMGHLGWWAFAFGAVSLSVVLHRRRRFETHLRHQFEHARVGWLTHAPTPSYRARPRAALAASLGLHGMLVLAACLFASLHEAIGNGQLWWALARPTPLFWVGTVGFMGCLALTVWGVRASSPPTMASDAPSSADHDAFVLALDRGCALDCRLDAIQRVISTGNSEQLLELDALCHHDPSWEVRKAVRLLTQEWETRGGLSLSTPLSAGRLTTASAQEGRLSQAR